MPFEHVKQFHDEYLSHCRACNVSSTQVAQEQTFRRAFLARTNVRLIGCKGSFQTCELCNNANELLRDPMKRYTREQRDIIQEFKFMHLKQQLAERVKFEENKNYCQETDSDGNAKSFMLAIGEFSCVLTLFNHLSI